MRETKASIGCISTCTYLLNTVYKWKQKYKIYIFWTLYCITKRDYGYKVLPLTVPTYIQVPFTTFCNEHWQFYSFISQLFALKVKSRWLWDLSATCVRAVLRAGLIFTLIKYLTYILMRITKHIGILSIYTKWIKRSIWMKISFFLPA